MDLWIWRNASLTRQWSLSQEEILFDQHQAWFERKIKDPNVLIYIFEDEGIKIGQVRFEAIDEKTAEINVGLNEKFLGQGYGSLMIGQASKKLMVDWPHVTEIKAKILTENIRSQKAFEKSDYSQQGQGTQQGKPVYWYTWTNAQSPLQLGLKVWAHNRLYVEPARKLIEEGICHFIELYVDKNASESDRDAWRNVGPVRLHAPHSYGGFNPAQSGLMKEKKEILKKVEEYREFFNPSSIIFHPGINGDLKESISQFQSFKKEFPEVFKIAFIENKPKLGLKGEFCCGAEPGEISQLMQAVGFGFCLDFGHATCYAAWAGISWQRVIDAFMALKPSLFHLSDGDISSSRDEHRHFGEGNYDLGGIVDRLAQGAVLTIETKHDFPDRLDDFRKDAEYLKGLKGK